jgi:hypothetical protein
MTFLLFVESNKIPAKLVRKSLTLGYKRKFLQLKGRAGYRVSKMLSPAGLYS